MLYKTQWADVCVSKLVKKRIKRKESGIKTFSAPGMEAVTIPLLKMTKNKNRQISLI